MFILYFSAVINRNLILKGEKILSFFPVLGIIGPRQVGKTTLSKALAKSYGNVIYLDMESPSDLEKLENAETFLQQYENHLIILDEVQVNKSLFPILRSIIDKNRKPGRFIILGSASPEIIRDSAESLAGRIAYLELGGLNLLEIYKNHDTQALWIRGGFPEPFLKPEMDYIWKQSYIQTYLERDLPLLGLNSNPVWSRRLWQMIAHLHGQMLNYHELSKSLEVDAKTIKKHLNFLEQAFMIHQLKPYHANTKKRLVKAPKIYFRDSGLLHHLLGINSFFALQGHPKMGSSWEGFVIEQIHQLKPDNSDLYFYRTHNGAELDLIIERNGVAQAGIEIKYGDKANISRGNTEAANELGVQKKFVIKQGGEDWPGKNDFIVTNLQNFLTIHLPTI